MKKVCQICKELKSLDLFGKNKRKADGRQTYCTVCSREKDKRCYANTDSRKEKVTSRRTKIFAENRRFVFEYYLKHPCVDCGESDPLVLEFDHINGEKEYGIASMKQYSRSTLEKEISKCVVRCSNCHQRKTAKERGWYKDFLVEYKL